MATFHADFMSLVASVVENCDEIGTYIQNTKFIVELYEGMCALHGYNSGTPLAYLKEWCWTRSWDEYFSHVMDLWDEKKMNSYRFNALIEKLSAPAAKLDVLVPRLERECRNLPEISESVIKNAMEMHRCVNSFLNSADDELYPWKRRNRDTNQTDIYVESDVRPRRPIIRQVVPADEGASGGEVESIKKPSIDSTLDRVSLRRHVKSLLKLEIVSNEKRV